MWGSQAFHLWNQWVFPLTSVNFGWALVCLNGDSSCQSQPGELHFAQVSMSHGFAAMHLALHLAAAVFWLMEDWDHHGRTSTGISSGRPAELWDVTEAANCISGQLSQLEQLGGIQGCWGAGWCHCEVTVSSQRSWTLEKLVYDWKNANSSWKGGQDNPSGHIPICHLRSKNQQSPTWFESSSSNLPSQELSVADWCE